MDNRKTDHKELDWNEMAKDRFQCLVHVNSVKNLCVSERCLVTARFSRTIFFV
jgi:hypothetical protein